MHMIPASNSGAVGTQGTPRILVVDDDPQIRQLIVRYLIENGFRASGARDGREMREAVAGADVDLLVLDLMLPGTSGLELCRELRQQSAIPIIMLTAKGSETDRIVGLELGADDYLPKPFNPRELLARIKAVLRRRFNSSSLAAPSSGKLEFARWILDVTRRELVSPAGALVELSTGEYDLLLALVENPQRVLSRERLLDLARNRAAGSFDRSIDVQISRLRRKIEGDSGPQIIKTIRGVGYMFVPAVHRL